MPERYIAFENYHKQLKPITPNDSYDQYFRGEKVNTPELFPATWMEINLSLYEQNIHKIQQFIGGNVGIIAVIKTDAYGHGIVPIAEKTFQAGVEKAVVKDAQEAAKLRDAGITGKLVCLYPPLDSDIKPLIERDVELTVTDLESLDRIALIAREYGKKIPIHIQAETGMNRYGAKPELIVPLVIAIQDRDSLTTESIFTHFATAGDDQDFLEYQFHNFLDVIRTLRDNNIQVPSIHVSNSDGIACLSDCWRSETYNSIMKNTKVYIRPGGMLFGTRTGLVETQEITTAIVSHISETQHIKQGERVGYKDAFIADRAINIACIPVGWDNGYLIQKGDVLINGVRAPIIGLVASLAFSIENTGMAEKNDRVLLAGVSGNERITLHELAQKNCMLVDQLWSILGTKMQRVYSE